MGKGMDLKDDKAKKEKAEVLVFLGQNQGIVRALNL